MFRGNHRPLGLLCGAALVLVSLGGCRQKMADQPSYTPLQASEFFEDDPYSGAIESLRTGA